VNEILTQEKSIYLQISEMLENDILRDILLEEESVPRTNVVQEKRDWYVCKGRSKKQD